MKMNCVECKAQMVDSVLEHTEECSANNFKRGIITDYLRLPATQITFDNEAERKRFMKGMEGGSGFTIPPAPTN